MTEFLTRSEVARVFHVHPKTVPAMVKRGVLPKPVKLDTRENARELYAQHEVDAAAQRLLAART